MGRVKYKTVRGFELDHILLTDTDATWLSKVKAMLDDLYVFSVGHHLLNDINDTKKTIVIIPPPNAQGGHTNMCVSGGDTIFYRLVAAFRQSTNYSVRAELGYALMHAAAAGWTLKKISDTVAMGMTPATVRTAQNLRPPVGARPLTGDQIAKMIEDVADGADAVILQNTMNGQHTLEYDLLRFLRHWLKPGSGAGSKVWFNPDGLVACMGDKMKKRPPAIGLAHELCHAWRNAVGQRLFDDAQGSKVDDDEIMTTGFPPYQYEKYSENLFRTAWGRTMDLRVNYR